MSTASCPAAACRPMEPGGSRAGLNSFCRSSALARLFRRLFLERLRKAFAAGMPELFWRSRAIWPLRRPSSPISRRCGPSIGSSTPRSHSVAPPRSFAYLGRYTHRVAIANSRLVAFDDDQVAFPWKDYRQNGAAKIMKLLHDEFIRRFLLQPSRRLPSHPSLRLSWPMVTAPRNSPCAARCSRISRISPIQRQSPTPRRNRASAFPPVRNAVASCVSSRRFHAAFIRSTRAPSRSIATRHEITMPTSAMNPIHRACSTTPFIGDGQYPAPHRAFLPAGRRARSVATIKWNVADVEYHDRRAHPPLVRLVPRNKFDPGGIELSP